jgi:hypothetical protein
LKGSGPEGAKQRNTRAEHGVGNSGGVERTQAILKEAMHPSGRQSPLAMDAALADAEPNALRAYMDEKGFKTAMIDD